MHPKVAEGIANSVDPDQTVKTCLSENVGKEDNLKQQWNYRYRLNTTRLLKKCAVYAIKKFVSPDLAFNLLNVAVHRLQFCRRQIFSVGVTQSFITAIKTFLNKNLHRHDLFCW